MEGRYAANFDEYVAGWPKTRHTPPSSTGGVASTALYTSMSRLWVRSHGAQTGGSRSKRQSSKIPASGIS